MLILISPAKTLDYETPMPSVEPSQAALLEHSAVLADQMKTQSPDDLRALMGISQDLAVLNVNRFQAWQLPFAEENSRPAVFAFKGDVYEGLDAYHLSDTELDFAQNHLRILSGLYGVLRPLDLIRPYRLEMGTRLENERGRNLYAFWGELPTELLNADLAAEAEPLVVNLASNEYYKVVKPRLLGAKVVTPAFLDNKKGEYKMISFWAKRARGLMTRYLIQQQDASASTLKAFNEEGYYYCPERSTDEKPVFIRDEAPAR